MDEEPQEQDEELSIDPDFRAKDAKMVYRRSGGGSSGVLLFNRRTIVVGAGKNRPSLSRSAFERAIGVSRNRGKSG